MIKNMRILTFIIQIIFTLSQSNDFYISLCYYSKPIINLEWSISIIRIGDRINVDIVGYMNKNLKREISRDVYVKLIRSLNKKGLWTLKDYYRKGSPNGYYQIEVKKGYQLNRFKVEAGIPLNGEKSKYLEIIKSITNIARLIIYD